MELFYSVESYLIILQLFVLEGVLSLDNSTVISSMVRNLPHDKQEKALTLGILGGFIFRVIALLLVNYLITIAWLKFLGGIYLLWIGIHFFIKDIKYEHIWMNLIKICSLGFFILYVHTEYSVQNPLMWVKIFFSMCILYMLYESHAHYINPAKHTTEDTETTNNTKNYWYVILTIGIADIAFSIDNIFVAVGVTQHLPLIIIGVSLGIISMKYVAQYINKLIKVYPFLDKSAHLVILFVSVKMMLSYICNVEEWHICHYLHSSYAEIIGCIITILIFAVPIALTEYVRNNAEITYSQILGILLKDGKINNNDILFLEMLFLGRTLSHKDMYMIQHVFTSTEDADNDPKWHNTCIKILKKYCVADERSPEVINKEEAGVLISFLNSIKNPLTREYFYTELIESAKVVHHDFVKYGDTL